MVTNSLTVLVAGSHGTTGQHVVRKLVERGHVARSMIRDADQADVIRELGGEPVVADLTGDVAHTVEGCDAVIFAAGSKGEALEAVDRDGAIALVDACVAHRVDRFIMLSSISADAPAEGPEELQPYLEAKHAADEHLRASGLTYTILQPGQLSDDPETGTVSAAAHHGHRDGTITRPDVAEALVESLQSLATFDHTIELLDGEDPIPQALREA